MNRIRSRCILIVGRLFLFRAMSCTYSVGNGNLKAPAQSVEQINIQIIGCIQRTDGIYVRKSAMRLPLARSTASLD